MPKKGKKTVRRKQVPKKSKSSLLTKRKSAPRRLSRRLPFAEFTKQIRLSLKPQDLETLKKAKLTSVQAIREKGGYGYLKTLNLSATDKTLRRLAGHAELMLISQDVEANDKIIAKGYTNPSVILQAGHDRFVSDVGDDFDELVVARMFAGATAQAGLLTNWTTGVRAELANRYPYLADKESDTGPNRDKVWQFLSKNIASINDKDDSCECRNCESAVSPLAYLADLLKYALLHIKNTDGNAITLSEFVNIFKQPFDELPVHCSAMEQQLRSMRVVIEVLRLHFIDNQSTIPEDSKKQFNNAVEEYRFATYQAILSNLGTSFEELRAAHSANPDVTARLMLRLGLPPNMADAVLVDFLLDPQETYPSQHAITEKRLEELFGLVDSTRDVLSDGPTSAATTTLQDSLPRWNLTTEWWRNTNSFGLIFVRVTKLVQFKYNILLYNDESKQAKYLVAQGLGHTTSVQKVAVHENNASGLAGELVSDYQGPGHLQLSAVPKFLSYRLIQLQESWKAEDWPADSYTDVTVPTLAGEEPTAKKPELPIIEPDLIGPDDMYIPLPTDDVYDLWVERRKWVDNQLNGLRDTYQYHGGLDGVFNEMSNIFVYRNFQTKVWSDDPKPYLPSYRHRLNESENQDSVAQSLEDDLALTLDEYSRLMEVRDKALAGATKPDEAPTGDEWNDLYSILVMAIKRRFYSAWIDDEVADTNYEFGPSDFVIAQREPKSGPWPPVLARPYIDPDHVSHDDLPESVAGWRTVELWDARKQQLKDIAQQFADDRITLGYQTVLENQLAQPLATLESTYEDLNSTDPTRVENATQFIEDTLELNADDFAFLWRVYERESTGGVSDPPSEEEWQRVDGILTGHNKRTVQYTAWTTDETNSQLGLEYFTALKAKLPPWRASTQTRAAWQDALRRRTASPLIEPDQIDLAFIRGPENPNNAAADLFEHRKSVINGRLAYLNPTIEQVENGSMSPLLAWHQIIVTMFFPTEMPGKYNRVIRNIMGAGSDPDPVLVKQFKRSIAELEQLYDNLNNNNDVDTTTDIIHQQLLIPVETFSQIMGLRQEILDGATGSQKNLFRSLLAEHRIVAGLIRLEDKQATGHVIRPRLEQLRVQPGEYSYVIRMRRSLADNQSLLRGEWDDLAAIAIQVYKRHHFERWRHEEQMGGIIHSPQLFQIPDTLPIESPVAWRFEPRAHRAWRTTLQGRIDQQRAITDEYYTAIDNAEAATLPLLRDAMVDVSGKSNAELSAQYAIDVANGPCQKTTRIGQAITTLQSIIRAARAGNLNSSELTFDAPNFKEEWKWLGSYATWRSSMFTFLYPENILLPSLNPRRTPGFEQLIEGLRSTRRLDRQDACELARRYSDYLEDVWPLEPTMSCEARTRFRTEGCGAEVTDDTGERYLVYLFGVGRKTKRPYWATYDSEGITGARQSFWAPIDGVSFTVIRIVAAIPYEASDNKRYIVVVLEDENGEYRITRYDLLGLRWVDDDPEPLDLQLPEDAKNAYVVFGPSRTGPPGVLIQLHGKVEAPVIYIGRLNEEALALEGDCLPTTLSAYGSNIAALYILGGTSMLPFSRALIIYNRVQGIVGGDPKNRHKVNATTVFLLEGEEGLRWELDSQKQLRGISTYHYEYRTSFVIDGGNQPRLYVVFSPKEGVKPASTDYQYAIISVNPVGAEYPVSVEKHGSFKAVIRNVTPLYRPWWATTVRIVYELDLPHLQRAYMHGVINTAHAGPKPEIEIAFANVPKVFQNPIYQMPYVVSDSFTWEVASAHRGLVFWLRYYGALDQVSLPAYLVEADYSVRIEIARQLQRSGDYEASMNWYRTVYDDRAIENRRKLYFGFYDEPTDSVFSRGASWFVDPLNPHEIVKTRAHAYLRFTLMSMVRTLLKYADNEFTRDTVESVTHATILYKNAIALLAVPELDQQLEECNTLIIDMIANLTTVIDAQYQLMLSVIEADLSRIGSGTTLRPLIAKVKQIITGRGRLSMRKRFAKARTIIDQAAAQSTRTLGESIALDAQHEDHLRKVMLRNRTLAELQTELVATAVDAYSLQTKTWKTTHELDEAPDLLVTTSIPTMLGVAPRLFEEPIRFSGLPFYTPATSIGFCIPPNPIPESFGLHAEVNLYKIRSCRNIAGDERKLEPYAAPTDTVSGLPAFGVAPDSGGTGRISIAATPYRYSVLIDRAKQLVQIAQQVESAFLATLEKRDAEAYTLLKARQDQRLARAGTKLQDMRVREAEGQVKLSELQEERARFQVLTYGKWLAVPRNEYEQAVLDAYYAIESARVVMAFANYTTEGIQALLIAAQAGVTGGAVFFAALGGAALVRHVASLDIAAAERSAQVNQLLASFERRRQEYEFQKSVAEHDGEIAAQQNRIAKSHVRVVGQERQIAQMQSDFANATVEYLGNKFTNVDLYEWMSDVLEGVYSYFLEQATSLAFLAQNQLAFERQEVPPALIKSDYWEILADEMLGDTSETPDRRGLTGSARLLQDIYQLDQYAFETDQRKHQLSKTISLSQLDPSEFQNLRETGIMRFSTPMALFDHDFPGHYLRLIKRVSVSVVALIPPTQGIKATLGASGISRVVIGGISFETNLMRRLPESVALSSPYNASGLFELQPELEKLLPFEGVGVDTTWEFLMPKTTNQFDFDTLMDVLLTIDYTALDSPDYRQQVLRELDYSISADLPFSIRQKYPDTWYHLHNPESEDAVPQIIINTTLSDFPPNIHELSVRNVLVHFTLEDQSMLNDVPVTLMYEEAGNSVELGGDAIPIDGTVSTARGNGGGWSAVRNKLPFGKWTIALPNTGVIRTMLNDGAIKDILFVITYAGRTIEWPQ